MLFQGQTDNLEVERELERSDRLSSKYLAGEVVSVSVAALADVPRLQGERGLVVVGRAFLRRTQVELCLKSKTEIWNFGIKLQKCLKVNAISFLRRQGNMSRVAGCFQKYARRRISKRRNAYFCTRGWRWLVSSVVDFYIPLPLN